MRPLVFKPPMGPATSNNATAGSSRQPMAHPPYPPPIWPGGAGVTPPHLMPGYPPPGASGYRPGAHPHPPYPYPPMPGMPHYPHYPAPYPPHPSNHPPPPSNPAQPPANGLAKPRPPKKPKQALGAAFSRAPLVRPGLGGVPISPFSTGPLVKKSVEDNEKEKEAKEKADRNAQKLAEFEPPGTVASTSSAGNVGAAELPNDAEDGTDEASPATEVVPSQPDASDSVPSTTQKATKGGPPANPMYGHRPFGYPRLMPPPPHHPYPYSHTAHPPPPTTKLPVVLSALPPSAPKPPIGSIEPMSFYDGKLYLNPIAYPSLTDADIKRMNEEMRNVGEVVRSLMGKMALPPPPSIGGPSGKKKIAAAKNKQAQAKAAALPTPTNSEITFNPELPEGSAPAA